MSVERDLLRLLAGMPFLDRLEMVAIAGWSRGAVYASTGALEEAGLVVSLPHASQTIAPTRRYCLTAAGLRRLAREEDASLRDLLRSYPVSAHWRRLLVERLDAMATIYRLSSTIASVHFPLRFRWYRALPMDAAVALPDGGVLALVREGHTADRTAFAKRLWRLREGPRPGAYLLIAPDAVRLRHARRLMARASAPAFLALERDATSAGAAARIWRTAAGSPLLDFEEVLSHVPARGAWPAEPPPARRSLPPDLRRPNPSQALGTAAPAFHLGPVSKRVLDLLSDWPWIAPAHLAGLLGVSERRVSQILHRLLEAGLAAREANGLALTDHGLSLLARRDRAAVGLARKRWSVAHIDHQAPLDWRNVSGRRSRQLLRHLDHTTAVHGFIAALAHQARGRGWDLSQLDPPHRASRFFRHGSVLRSVHPDAFGILHREGVAWPFFLEWERRAVRPATMAARLAPYLRYYATRRPTDDHGALPSVLIVFDGELAQARFLHVAHAAMARAGVDIPLWVSHRTAIVELGPLESRAWRRLGEGGSPWRGSAVGTKL